MDRDQIRANRLAWETIAESFHSTRNRPWGAVEQFLSQFPSDSRILDAGCGNGRHVKTAFLNQHSVVGLDLSPKLLRLARQSVGVGNVAWVEGVVERLPFRDGRFDGAMALAVLHHVRGQSQRIATILELLRVVKPGGRVMLSVWSRDQARFGPGKEPRVPADGRPTEPGDAHVRWTQHKLNVDRFIHLYSWVEWQRELDYANVRIERVWPEGIQSDEEPDNFFAILRKRSAGREKP